MGTILISISTKSITSIFAISVIATTIISKSITTINSLSIVNMINDPQISNTRTWEGAACELCCRDEPLLNI